MRVICTLRAPRWAALFLALVTLRARAAHAEVPVDDLLASVAEVVKDRAKKAAARAIKRNIVDNLCKDEPVELAVNQAKLTIGGDKTCFDDRTNDSCNADDVFVASCRLLRQDGIGLSDPYFLRTLGSDTVGFVFRVAGSRFDATDYEKHGLDELATTTYELATAILEDKPIGPAVANALDDVARVVGKDFPKVTLLALRPKGLDLYRAVRKHLLDGCSGASDRVCTALTGTTEAWKLDLGTTNDASTCAAWRRAGPKRRETFETLFGPAATYAPYREEKSCNDLTGAAKAECTRGRLTYNLLDHLSKVVCSPNLGEAEARGSLRQLSYVYAQLDLYQDYLSSDNTATAALDVYATDIRSLPLKGVPAEELANTIRLIAVIIRSSSSDREALEQWFDLLRRDFESLVSQLDSADLDKAYMEFLRGSALASPQPCAAGKCNSAVNDVREAMKNLLVTPYLYVPGSKDFTLFKQRIRGMATLVAALRTVKTGADLREVVKATADLLELFGSKQAVQALKGLAEARFVASQKLVKGISAASTLDMVEADKDSTGNATASIALALRELSVVIELIGEKDWVGLAIHAAHVLEDNVPDKLTPLRRSFKFMRVLMGMYQADSKDEAKEIFAAALDDEASREERYDRGSVDIAALVGAGGGAHFLDNDPMDEELHGLLGLYAPFGLQLSYKRIGLFIYPLDLGAYLVASSEEPTWTDAVRAGGAVEFRPWQYTPIDLVVGMDYRPAFGTDQEQLRILGGFALELPLFGLN